MQLLLFCGVVGIGSAQLGMREMYELRRDFSCYYRNENAGFLTQESRKLVLMWFGFLLGVCGNTVPWSCSLEASSAAAAAAHHMVLISH